MKRKIFSIGVVIVLLASMLMFAGPASADTLAWSVQPTPTALFNQTANNTDVANVNVAPNGDIFVIDATSANLVYKSVDGGRNWSKSLPISATGQIVDLAVSPSYATDGTVFVVSSGIAAGAPQVYISTNGGISFAVLGGTLTAGEIGTSIAVAPNYSGGTGEVMVGTQAAGGATYGNVYIWGRNGVLNWSATALTKDVMEVAYSPNYAIDATRLAVAANTSVGTTVDTMIATGAWNAGSIPTAAVVDATVNGTGATNPISAANIAFPSDFNASLAFNRTVFVALQNTGAIANNVFRVTVGLGAPVAMNPLALYGFTDHPMTSIVYSGTAAAGTLFAGGGAASTAVMRCANPSAGAAAIAWLPAVAPPSGVGTVWLAKANDFATSNKLYAGTTGANSALSISDDGGAFFYQSGMIHTLISAVEDFVAASTSELFLATRDTTANISSVWKSMDAGATWYRYMSPASNNPCILRISPNYATDMTIFWASTGTTAIQISNNGGNSWTGRTSPITIGDIAVKDQYTFYIGGSGAGSVQSTVNGGWTYQPVSTTVATTGGPAAITDIDIDIATGHILVGGDNGMIYLSTNANVSYVIQSVTGIGTGTTIVAFDSGYSTNNFIYAGSATGGTASVKRFQVGTYTAWLGLGDGTPAGSVMDIVSAPDGTLYVSDNTVGTGMHRSINPTAGFPTLNLSAWNAIGSAFGGGLGATAKLGGLAVTAGSNVVYGIDTVLNLIYVYTDTLTQAIPAPTGPVPEAILDSTGVTFTWDAIAGATLYDVQYGTRADWVGAALDTTTNPFDTFWRLATGTLTSGATYYWRVRVNSPVLGPWSEANTFTAQLSTTAPTSPNINVGAVEGGTGPGGWDASLTPSFYWQAVKAATGYEFQLSASSDFSGALIVDLSGASALGPVNTYSLTTPLAYNTTYYWRVRALGAAATTDWSSIVPFTTMVEPEEAPPPVTVAPAPTPTITIPAAPPATTFTIPAPEEPEQIAPGYIWAVIIIGAVLVIALIVLIVRTRRSV